MRKVLHGMSNVDNFIDDILVYTETLEHHFSILKQLFQRLLVMAKPSKCILGFNTIDYLGHMIGNEQLKPDSGKVEVIRRPPPPPPQKKNNQTKKIIFSTNKFFHPFFSLFFKNILTPPPLF